MKILGNIYDNYNEKGKIELTMIKKIIYQLKIFENISV